MVIAEPAPAAHAKAIAVSVIAVAFSVIVVAAFLLDLSPLETATAPSGTGPRTSITNAVHAVFA